MQEFIVNCVCGHLSPSKCFHIPFPVVAESGKDAAAIARLIPRVRHNQKDAIVSVKKVTHEEYMKQVEQNKNDPYLFSHSKQEQNMYMDQLADRIISVDKDEIKYRKSNRVNLKYQSQKYKDNLN